MKRALIFLCFLFLFFALKAQSHMIQVELDRETEGWIYLAAYEKDHFEMIDSLQCQSGPFMFVLPRDTPPGVYRLIYSELDGEVLISGRIVEIIYNDRDLKIMVETGEQGPVPHFEQSPENQVYQDFVDFQMAYEHGLSELYSSLVPERPGDPGFERAVEAYEALQAARLNYIDSVRHSHPDLFATRMISAFRVPVTPGSISHRQRIDTLKLLFFKDAPIDDPGLLRAPVYSYRIVDYLSIYQDPSLDFDAQQAAFVEAVDMIMVNVDKDPELRGSVVDFLLDGFEILGMEKVQMYIAQNYLDENCTSDVALLVQQRTEAYNAMKTGTIAPDFGMRDARGRNYRLSTLDQELVLVIFWATSCGHCQQLMPDIYRWYEQERKEEGTDLEVVAFSIDTSVVAYEQYLEIHPMGWINVNDPMGWNGKVAGDYHIYATPTMFLLDRQRRIISRPVNLRQLERALRNL